MLSDIISKYGDYKYNSVCDWFEIIPNKNVIIMIDNGFTDERIIVEYNDLEYREIPYGIEIDWGSYEDYTNVKIFASLEDLNKYIMSEVVITL